MKKLLFILLSLLTFVWGEPSAPTDGASPLSAPQEEVTPAVDDPVVVPVTSDSVPSISQGARGGISLKLSSIPNHLHIGEIFPVTLKVTPIDVASGNIEYSLQGEEGIRIFSQTPVRRVRDDGVYDTFYFLVQSDTVRIPDIAAMVTSTGEVSPTLEGMVLSASPLSPPATYANVLADSFKVIDYKTTAYNQTSNIVVFTVKAKRCNIATFSLANVLSQGFESKLPNVDESVMTYYAIIPNNVKSLDFTIFNLSKNRYESMSIPIVVVDDAVSTQSDLSPTDFRHTELKVGAALFVAAISIGIYFWRRSRWYLYFSVLPLVYVIMVFLPNSTVCVKKGTPVYLLPITHGTVFETTAQESKLEIENRVGNFVKVRLENEKVGWVNEHDFCSN